MMQRQKARASLEKRKDHPRLILGLASVAAFMGVLDFNIVQVALPTIRTQLSMSYAASEWIISIYGIPLAGFLIVSSRLGDLYGRRKVFSLGLIIFAISSLAAGLSVSSTMLISARAAQGLGAALFTATALTMIAAGFGEGKERERAVSLYVASGGIGAVVGLTLGGAMTYLFGWRSIMLVNVPIGLVGALIAFKVLGSKIERKQEGKEKKNENLDTRSKIDLLGAVSVTSGLVLFVFALTEATSSGFQNFETIGFLSASFFIFAYFLWNEHRAKAPLVPLGFIRKKSQLSANLGGMVAPAGYSGLIFTIATFMQTKMHYSPLIVGLAFVPAGVFFALSSAYVAPNLSHWTKPKYALIVGISLMVLGFALMVRVSENMNYFFVLLPALVVFTTGTGLSFTTAQTLAVSNLENDEEGIASGIINTSRYVGIPVGLALLVAVGSYSFVTGAAVMALSAILVYFL